VIPALTVIPGLIALVLVPGLGNKAKGLDYTNAIPILIGRFLPNGVLGIAITGLLAAFMAGMAANVSAFNTVVTYDIYQPYIRPDQPDEHYLRVGRIVTVLGVLIGIATALIASGYSNIMNYIQLLFSLFNAPLFATFIIALFWRRATPWAGFWGLVAGTLGAIGAHLLLVGIAPLGVSPVWHIVSQQAQNFWGAIVAFVSDVVITFAVSMVTVPKPESELRGLVWRLARTDERPEELSAADRVWYRRPALLGIGALAAVIALDILYA
jgi:SSS family solute:Na+ symporter